DGGDEVALVVRDLARVEEHLRVLRRTGEGGCGAEREGEDQAGGQGACRLHLFTGAPRKTCTAPGLPTTTSSTPSPSTSPAARSTLPGVGPIGKLASKQVTVKVCGPLLRAGSSVARYTSLRCS